MCLYRRFDFSELAIYFIVVQLFRVVMVMYCESCEEDVPPKIDDEWPFDSYCPQCGLTLVEGDS